MQAEALPGAHQSFPRNKTVIQEHYPAFIVIPIDGVRCPNANCEGGVVSAMNSLLINFKWSRIIPNSPNMYTKRNNLHC